MSQINSKNTKYELANALVELCRECTFNDISISSIAFKANMHRNTVYYHFSDIQDLCFFAIHNELSAALNSRADAKDALIFFFSRYKQLLDFTKYKTGLEDFLNHMRKEILPLIEPMIVGEYVNSDEKKRTAVDVFTEQVLVAYLMHEHPGSLIRIILENIMPEFLSHDYL